MNKQLVSSVLQVATTFQIIQVYTLKIIRKLGNSEDLSISLKNYKVKLEKQYQFRSDALSETYGIGKATLVDIQNH